MLFGAANQMDMRCVHSDTKPVAAPIAAVTERGWLSAGAHNDAAAVLMPRELCEGSACNTEWGAGPAAEPISDRTAAAACVAARPLPCLKRDMVESVLAGRARWQPDALQGRPYLSAGELSAAMAL